jgi:sugar/nucleoside kinase (ribokinase family)
MSCGLAAAARLGSRCRALGRLGENELSQFVYDVLGGCGVDLSLLQKQSEAEPVYCVIIVSKETGSRAIYGDYNRTNGLQPHELKPEWFSSAKVLLVDHYGPPTILQAVRLAKAAGLQVISDIERDVPEFPEIRKHIDHLVCSAEFAVPYTKTETPAAACESLEKTGRHATVVVTAGEHGCYYCTRENATVRPVPAHPVKPVDTTGCGDVFHGVFCHGIAQGWPIEKAIQWANAGAAIKATRTGGWLAVPRAEEIEQLLVGT